MTPAAAVPRTTLRRWLPWCAGVAVALLLVLVVVGLAVARHVQPLLRSRLVNTLGERFDSPVALDALTVHYDGGLQVDGGGLRVQSVLRGVPGSAAHPMLRVSAFHFHVGLLAAISDSPRIHHVRIRGVQLDLPAQTAQTGSPIATKHEVNLEYAEVDDAHVRFASAAADRAPLVFDLPHLELRGVSRSRPIRFKATVDHGVPIGLSQTEGTIGPWNFDDPRRTPIEGRCGFQDKDVSGVRGLRGRLSLDGRYQGFVGEIHAEGTTDDPSFGLDVSGHTVRLRTRFALVLRATAGEVALEKLDGQLGNSAFALAGTAIKRAQPEGFALDMQLHAPSARAEDVLTLMARTQPPVLRGTMQMDGRLTLRTGEESVSQRLGLQDGRFAMENASFRNADVQEQVNSLAARAGDDAAAAKAGEAPAVTATVHGTAQMRDATVRFSQVEVTAPGVAATLHGRYGLRGTEFAFDGTVHTEAKLSHMTTGVKRVLLKPFNGLLGHAGRHGGATLPLHITGAGDVPHFSTRLAGVKLKAPGTD